MSTAAKVGCVALGVTALCFAPLVGAAIGVVGGVQWQLATIRVTVQFLRHP